MKIEKGWKVLSEYPACRSIIARPGVTYGVNTWTRLVDARRINKDSGPLTVFETKGYAIECGKDNGWFGSGSLVPCEFVRSRRQEQVLKGHGNGLALLPKGTVLADAIRILGVYVRGKMRSIDIIMDEIEREAELLVMTHYDGLGGRRDRIKTLLAEIREGCVRRVDHTCAGLTAHMECCCVKDGSWVWNIREMPFTIEVEYCPYCGIHLDAP